MTRTQWPTPEQIGAYLTAHGWRFDRAMKQPGAVYVYHQRTDAGEPVELFVPSFSPQVDAVEDFATSVLAVAETIQAMEHRDRDSVLAEMLAINITHAASATPTQDSPPVPTA